MTKNLKKVISAVAALALTVSSFVAMAAYPDVPADSQYASAINELSALNIVNGFEDGTFHPDELVTRAQMAKMVVGALNIANAESNAVQKFNDVPADNWAAGWVATAADNGIINGTGNGNFDPSLNVTYAQTAKMLVAAMGYETWAQNQGGWPAGYLYYANATGVTNNISGVSNDTALTRAQCAQMIANALEGAMLKQTSMTTNMAGDPVAIMSQMDGTNEDKSPFTSLLTDKWDIYVVNGVVTGTDKSTGSSSNKINYTVQKSKNYDGRPYGTSLYNNYNGNITINPNKGTTDADKYFGEYTKALVYSNDYDEPTVMFIESAGKNVKETFNTNLFSEYDTANNTIKVRKSVTTQTTTSYKMSKDRTTGTPNWALIVNGVAVAPSDIKDYMNTYNPGVEVTLIDNPTDGVATDGYYDIVNLDYFVTAVVDSIVEGTDKTTIYFKDASATISSIEVKKDDDDYSYSFVKDDVAIDVADLKENDVLSIACDPTKAVKDSMFYDILVSDATVEGKVTQGGRDDYDEIYYTIGGTDYTVVGGMNPTIKVGNEYTAYLSATGRIAAVDKLAASVNYAILDRVYKSNSGEVMVRIIGKDGQKHEYELYDETAASDPNGVAAKMLADAGKAWSDRITNVPLTDRIVDYTITSGNKIKLRDGKDINYSDNTKKTYTLSTKRLGSTKVDDATIVLDLADWYDDGTAAVSLVSIDSLVDGSDYSYIAVKDTSSTSAEAVPFIAVYEGLGGFTVDTQMAIVSKVMQTSDNGSDRVKLQVYLNGELQEVLCEDTSSTYANLKEGDAIIFVKDSDGYVNELYKITNFVDADKYTILDAICDGDAINAKLPSMADSDGPVEFVLAPVIDKDASSITLGTVKYGTPGDKAATMSKYAWYMDETGDNISYDANVKVYTFNGENTNGYRVEMGAAAAVVKSQVIKANVNTASYLDNAGSLINLGMEDDNALNPSLNTIAFALVRVHDDEIKEVYSISTSEANGAKAPFVGD